MKNTSSVQTIISRIQKHPLVMLFIFITTLLAGILSFTNTLDELRDRFFPEESIYIEGEWIANIEYPWIPNQAFEEHFHFSIQGDQLVGFAGFLGFPRMVHSGILEGENLNFEVHFEMLGTNTNQNMAANSLSKRQYLGTYHLNENDEPEIQFSSMNTSGNAEPFEFVAIRPSE